MNKSQKSILLINALLLPIIPLLFLYNQNSQHLLFKQIAALGFILIFIVAIFHLILTLVFKSEVFAFLGSLIFVVLLFAHNSIYNFLIPYGYSSIILLSFIPFLTYIATYLLYKTLNKFKFEYFSMFTTVFVFSMLLMNLMPLIYSNEIINNNVKIEYKNDFIINDKLPSPNVYFLLCDGMLGFDAMEKYFNDSQKDLIKDLTNRGFSINKSAMLESAHQTRIAIPALMSPDYNDRYLKDILSDHQQALKLSEGSDSRLYISRVNNETINAFDKKGYTTISISVNDKFFLPNTDYYYYIDAYYRFGENHVSIPVLVQKSQNQNQDFDNNRVYAHQLGDIFLAGIPSRIYDKFFSNNEIHQIELSTSFDGVSKVLLESEYSKINSALITSIYDVLYSKEISNPKFVTIHNLIAHGPFNLDENGNNVEFENISNINYYPGHHKYASKVLINIIDMILKKDPDSVIIIQADHGLHMQSKDQIIEAFGSDAPIDIWNNVISAIRIPKKYETDDDFDVINEPRNIFRYLINNFVGKNYKYLDYKVKLD